jgi:hypothetical protein
MKTRIRLLLLTAVLVSAAQLSYGYKYPTEKSGPGQKAPKQVAEACLAASASTDLDVNNVRARINTGGDMWWDLQGNAEYFIPKNTFKTSMFNAALWIGGLDVNGQLKLAAQRYREDGVDYFTGPLTNDGTASVDAETCDAYDRHWVITRAEVEAFMAAWEMDPTLSGYEVPRSILEYPGNGDPEKNQSLFLAPFFDRDGDQIYDPKGDGDYPYYDFDNSLCPKNLPDSVSPALTMEGNGRLVDQILKGDKTIWWVFNDKGNIHGETKGAAIGMEIRAQAFGFATNDEINNMTFYSYEIINRSTYRLTQTYFSQWVDTDLGDAWDDYVGCDVLRGLGYCYNGKDPDGTGKPGDYGAQPPAVGVDFFQGPYMDPDTLDNPAYDITNPTANCGVAINGVNFGDGIVDNERFGMRRFVFHNNTGAGLQAMQDPEIASEYYNLLRGIWKDNQVMVYWGLGHPNAGGTGPACAFMFPGSSDPCNWGTNGVNPGSPYPSQYWTEEQAGNPPYDRRFMQSAGPFTLEPGAVNYITVGIPWARATSGGPAASVRLLQTVDDKCQTLFDNCFKVLDGPDAPDLAIQELDRELILYISNKKGISNNYNTIQEDYYEVDPNIVFADSIPAADRGDSAYRFEGYQIFQLKDATVSIADIKNTDKSRLVAQCDIKNGVSKLVNFYYDEALNGSVPVEEVNGADAGIVHSFRIFEDQFASVDKRLVNHKQYYYIAIAYAYNNFKSYNQSDPLSLDGQKQPYKAGRKSAAGAIKFQTGIPHIPSPEASGTIVRSEYGIQPMITRVEGHGNGGITLDLTQASLDNILANNKAAEIEYQYNKGPVNIKVIDPLNVIAANYTLRFDPQAGSEELANCGWTLINNDNGTTWTSERSISVANEQLIPEIGLSINIEQIKFPGDANSLNNGFQEATISFADSTKQWLGGIYDQDAYPNWNWILAGTKDGDAIYPGPTFIDPDEVYEKLMFGSWAPYALCSSGTDGPAFAVTSAYYSKAQMMANLASIDLVITSDRSKWSRCPVFEMSEPETQNLAEGNVEKLELRAGSTDGEQGMGWFPGYAINVETGERLNVAFGEDSYQISENGRDMIWNPTSNYTTNMGNVLFGGKHWIYIFNHNRDSIDVNYGAIDCPAYDGGQWIKNTMLIPATHAKYKQFVFKDVVWVGGPMLSNEIYNFTDPSNIPCDVKIRIRVSKPYQRFYSSKWNGPASPVNNNYPLYRFNTNDISVVTGSETAAEGALELINVVPNPYYGYSAYETNQLDNRVRITNLPQKCTVSIYSINGNLIRQFSKDDPITSLDWDLKNSAGIPIAGGLYLIYVKVDGGGEKVIKWFGALRPIDLNSF